MTAQLKTDLSVAYHCAGWQRAKKMPELGPILRKIGKDKRKPQTPQQALRVAEQLNAMFGGKDLRAQRQAKG